ncbi:MAG: phosphoribosylformylglycinamidine synthase subunit PurQ, partial [Actinomycetota bacterium]
RGLRGGKDPVRVAVVVFPGSNCELDAVHALDLLGAEPELVFHRETDLSGADAILLPGGFAHGDYLRTGAIARFSPVMAEVERHAEAGTPILGICNGFQILTEAGLLPGALVANRDLRFICRPIHVRVESTESVLTRNAEIGQVLRIPLNSYEGNYVVDSDGLGDLESRSGVVLRYSDRDGSVGPETNPNGSTRSIAGITNAAGNVAGLMPHPERAVETILGSTDGRVLLESFVASMEAVSA